MTKDRKTPVADAPAGGDFFDASFLGELEELAGHATLHEPTEVGSGLHEKLSAFLAPLPGADHPLTEDEFVEMAAALLTERTNGLVDMVRGGGRGPAVLAVENFVVFFQALVPTLAETSREVKRVFFRLVPTLLHIAYDSDPTTGPEDGCAAALRNLETILIEISSVRLAPSEGELVFRSIDQMAGFIASGDYTMASEVVSQQLISLITRNKLLRSLYRLMEVEVSVQAYLKSKLGYMTPQIRLPEDAPALAEYGPVRILNEEMLGTLTRYIQVQIPDIPILRDVMLRLVRQQDRQVVDLRLDALGSAVLDVPPGTYSLGLVYEPEAGS